MMCISKAIIANSLIVISTIAVINGKHLVPGCHDFKTGVTKSDRPPSKFTLYTQAYRDLRGLTAEPELKCDRMNITYDPRTGQLSGQSTFINTTNGDLHRVNFDLHQESPGAYTCDKPEDLNQVYQVLKVASDGIYLYSCARQLGFNLIRFQTYIENPTNIAWDKVSNQFKSFGFPGYLKVDQKLEDCKNYLD